MRLLNNTTSGPFNLYLIKFAKKINTNLRDFRFEIYLKNVYKRHVTYRCPKGYINMNSTTKN